MTPQQPKEDQFLLRKSSRGSNSHVMTGQHVSLQTLRKREIPQDHMMKNYLQRNIPPYPSPVEFWVSDVTHVTEKSGFEAILELEEFRHGAGEFLWWSLKINENEIREAEKRYIEEQMLNTPQPFLEKFTTSPAFVPESRYGNYRFTFPLVDLMKWYKEQNCEGKEPVLRIHETVTYKQEIMYSVLIHLPEDNERFEEYPLLETSELVRYKDGKIMWRAQAICSVHKFKFVSGEVQTLVCDLYYVWDHVSLIFHLSKPKTLKIHKIQLIKSLSACEIDEVDLTREDKCKSKSEKYWKAVRKVKELRESYILGV